LRANHDSINAKYSLIIRIAVGNLSSLISPYVIHEGKVTSVDVPRIGYRWHGSVTIDIRGTKVTLLMSGTVAQWLQRGEVVRVTFKEEPIKVGNIYVASQETYELSRLCDGELVKIWPVWSKDYRLPRYDPLNVDVVYEYVVGAHEAVSEEDFMEIVQLEQYHYASKEELVAIWRCPICGKFIESNVQPKCPDHGVPMKLQEIRGSLPSSRFLILELIERREYEPKVIGYVRVDTPVPLMSRRLPDGTIEKLIREKWFPKDWFHPTYWPEVYTKRAKLLARYRELLKEYGSRKLARAVLGEEVSREALVWSNTAAARIARVVVHPDYRGDGLGVLAVKAVIEWIKDRRIPEMKRRKHIIEVIAQMARYNPFFEKAGFKYMWDTASGRPVLMYPLTDEAKKRINEYLSKDRYGKMHGGVLYRSRYGKVKPLSYAIKFINVSKRYSSTLDISKLPVELQDILKAFGVERRVVERYVIRNATFSIKPRDVVVVIGASGAGKTTLLRLIIGSTLGGNDPKYKPDEGKVELPKNAKVAALLPCELEPKFGDESLLEHITRKVGDAGVAVEIINLVGLSDAVFYRAKFSELSTGQKERAKLASLLAEKPNLLIIDEFTAHLDVVTARRVARRLGRIVREAGITLVVATNRPEVISALAPTKIIFVGYGKVAVMRELPKGAKLP